MTVADRSCWTRPYHAVFDVELIGTHNPVFLVCVSIVELGKRAAFWWHRPGDMAKLSKLLSNDAFTWVGFNSWKFDLPIVSYAMAGANPAQLKDLSARLIEDNMMPWEAETLFGFEMLKVDHIDVFNVAPGVEISLKRYMGRMGYPSLIDMPFHHTKDLEPNEYSLVEKYCFNDVGGTTWLLKKLKTELDLRVDMSAEYGIDLRSKSDAQMAEAIIKKRLELKSFGKKNPPPFVSYSVPDFIHTDSPIILDLIEKLEATSFTVNPGNGSPEVPEFLAEPVKLGYGTYQMGIGGLHSTHDVNLYVAASDELCVSDFDVASYYPNVIMKAGLIPAFGAGKGERFIAEYTSIYHRRMEAKHSGNKKVANSLKILLNGTFGKLGSIYSAFYAPDLMLAVTISGQLNLMCLIHDVEKVPGALVISANTDGIMVAYPPAVREQVEAAVAGNASITGFEYEETRYYKVAMKDVNNYLAVVADYGSGSPQVAFDKDGTPIVKSKGLYAPKGLMKNPTMQVCSNMARDYLVHGTLPDYAIYDYSDPEDFMAVREVQGGGIQYEGFELVDDWVEVADREWRRQAWIDSGIKKASVKRKSRPRPVEVGVGGVPFGRVARWYMTREFLPPICYVGSGNKVPKTEGAKLCMVLPESLPDDLDWDWYIKETYSMLKDMGISLENSSGECM